MLKASCLSLLIAVAVPGLCAAQGADNGAAGPDFWAVSGVSETGSLNVRSEASASAPVVIQIANGTVLRNLGCEGQGDARWCRVESPDGITVKGWVAGRFLVESAPPTEGDALVEGTPYNATGDLPCVLKSFPDVTSCPFGVIRVPEKSLASIFITLPNGEQRLLEFRDGEPVEPAGTTMTSSQVEDLTEVDLDNGHERYSIFDIVYAGD